MRRSLPLVSTASALLATSLHVAAQTLPAPAGVLNLTTTATIEVPRDVLTVVFSVTREGADAQAVQGALKQALDAALVEARRIARADQVEVQTGNFALYPRYSNPGPRGGTPAIAGWTGSAELTAQGLEGNIDHGRIQDDHENAEHDRDQHLPFLLQPIGLVFQYDFSTHR